LRRLLLLCSLLRLSCWPSLFVLLLFTPPPFAVLFGYRPCPGFVSFVEIVVEIVNRQAHLRVTAWPPARRGTRLTWAHRIANELRRKVGGEMRGEMRGEIGAPTPHRERCSQSERSENDGTE